MEHFAYLLALTNSEGWFVRVMTQLSPVLWRVVLDHYEDDGVYITPDADCDCADGALTLAIASIPRARFLPYAISSASDLAPINLTSLGLGAPPPPTFALAKRFAK